MSLELLLILNCIGSSLACSKSLEAYYTYDTHLTRKVNSVKLDLENYYKANRNLQVAAPIVGYGLVRDATIKLNKTYSLRVSTKFNGILYSREF